MTASPTTVAPTVAPGRLRSLDGLRGVAALVVVLHHTLMVLPQLAMVHLGPVLPEPGTAAWWIVSTPLRIVWAGQEAVLVFFVLSGYVLTVYAQRRLDGSRPGAVRAYYVQRLARLYLPVWGAVALALAVALAIPRDGGAASLWLAMHADPDALSVVMDLTLLGGIGPAWLDSPLWSLAWEIWFSLLLPVMWLLVRRLPVRGHGGVWIILLVAVSVAAPHLGLPVPLARPLEFLPVFGIGMVLAHDSDRPHRAAAAVTARGPWAWPAVLLLSWLALVAPSPGWGAQGLVPGLAADALALAGVVGLLVAAMTWGPLLRALERRPAQWLGRRSFSLYLVHEPVVVALALLTGATGAAWVLWSTVAVVVSLALAAGFFLAVEQPALGLSRSLGERAALRPAYPPSPPRPRPRGSRRR
ncbi:acyltransferase family protein [Antribacter gilvus]|uniref:acyltransferase family protein n=1 Tax=Antribacter gilvus TaxID=2304675 RepID=UPI000F79A479|nr:acyltransferase [Antribacter gilvus]